MSFEQENYDLNSEKVVIASLLEDNGFDLWSDISDIITPSTFIADTHQVIYKCINAIRKSSPEIKKINFPLLLSTSKILKFGDFFEKKEEKEYLKDLVKNQTDRDNAKILSIKLRKLEIVRIIREQLKLIDGKLANTTGQEKASELLAIAEKPILDLSQALYGCDVKGPELIFLDINDYIQDKIDNPVTNVGISSGWKFYDQAIGGGFRPGGVGVIASRYKVGKSSCAINIGYNVISQNIPVLYLDTEMSKEEHIPRMLAKISGVSIFEIETGLFGSDSNKKEKIKKAGKKIKELPFHYQNICGMDFDQVISIMKSWLLKTVGLNNNGLANKSLIILDYLKIQSSGELDKNIAEHVRLGLMMTAYVNFVQKYQIAALTFAQLNREGRSGESDSGTIAGADKLAWFGQHISLLRTQTDEELEQQKSLGSKKQYNRKLVTTEARHGPGMESNNYLNIEFQTNCCNMIEGPCQFNLGKETNTFSQEGNIIDDNDDNIPF